MAQAQVQGTARVLLPRFDTTSPLCLVPYRGQTVLGGYIHTCPRVPTSTRQAHYSSSLAKVSWLYYLDPLVPLRPCR